jgi:hypothetical protein
MSDVTCGQTKSIMFAPKELKFRHQSLLDRFLIPNTAIQDTHLLELLQLTKQKTKGLPFANLNMISFLLHVLQSAIGGYALYHSSISIPNLQKYDGKSKSASKYFQSIANERHSTRTTQAAGAIAVSLSCEPCSPSILIELGSVPNGSCILPSYWNSGPWI